MRPQQDPEFPQTWVNSFAVALYQTIGTTGSRTREWKEQADELVAISARALAELIAAHNHIFAGTRVRSLKLSRSNLDTFHQNLERLVAMDRITSDERNNILDKLHPIELYIQGLTEIYEEISMNPLRAGLFAVRKFIRKQMCWW
ncbi:MAG: hypothetical protein KDA90_23730 [Planctomycetaceae bacterium]|nr:hypothetical protein [Planctomycetaceae bacterium]